MQITVRKTNNFKDAYRIAASLPGYFDEVDLPEIEKAVRTEQLFGAFSDRKMVGFATFKEINPQVVELTWLGVLDEYQGQGIGQQLLTEGLKSQEGYRLCKVKTLAGTVPDEGYEKTRRFYHKFGFIDIEVIDPYPGWGPGNPCLIMVKIL